MIKSLVLITLFFVLVYKYIKLHKNYINQREYFIKTLSHDLRVATLAQIRGLEILGRTVNSEILDEINESCKFSLDMITMLLNTYKLERGDKILNYEKINLVSLVRDVEQILYEKFRLKNIAFKIHNSKKFLVDGDKDLLLKLFLLLISTAIDNSFTDNQIIVKFLIEDDMLKVTLGYRGCSLSEEECRRMFLNQSRFSTVGHGIKMYLCKKIVDFHNGKIFVYQNIRKENSFVFKIPLKQPSINPKKYLQSKLQLVNS